MSGALTKPHAVRRKGIFRLPNQSMMKYGVVTIVQRPAIVQNTNWKVTTCPREVERMSKFWSVYVV